MTIRKTVIGITGTNGIGKTTFLRKVQHDIETQGIQTIYFSPLVPETSLFREFAKTLLFYALAKKVRLDDLSESKIIEHLHRFNCRVSVEESSEGGIDWKIFTGKLVKKTEKNYEQYNEDSAISLIVKILKSLTAFCVIFIDDMETMKHTISDSDIYIRKMMYLARFLRGQFLQDNTCFICSLDKEFYKAIQEETSKRTDSGSLSFYFNDIETLENLSTQELRQLILSRLQAAGYSKSLNQFITSDAFIALSLATERHPRKILRVIEAALIEGAINKVTCIDLTTILTAIKQQRFTYDEINFKILQYISEKSKTSSIDKGLHKTTNLKERQLRERLSVLLLQQMLSVQEERTGVQRTKIYRLQ
jgi:dethiobiotin synthetase